MPGLLKGSLMAVPRAMVLRLTLPRTRCACGALMVESWALHYGGDDLIDYYNRRWVCRCGAAWRRSAANKGTWIRCADG